MVKFMGAALLASALAVPAWATPVEIVTKVLSEQRVAARDGTTRISLTPAARVTPGDRLVYQITYRNTGPKAVSDFVLTNPLPAAVEYIAAAGDSATPEMSVDGTTFAALAGLRVRTADGGWRAATVRDVRVVRWRLAKPLAAGGQGQVSFRALLR